MPGINVFSSFCSARLYSLTYRWVYFDRSEILEYKDGYGITHGDEEMRLCGMEEDDLNRASDFLERSL